MKIKRPDLQEVYDLRVLTEDIDKKLGRISSFHASSEDGIRQALQNFRKVKAGRELSAVSVNVLQSIIGKSKTDLLKSAGILNIRDVWETDRKELIALNGIGKVTADRIIEAVEGMAEVHMQDVPVRIRAGLEAEEEQDLVHAVYMYYRSKQLSEKAEEYYMKTHGMILNVLRESEAVRSKLGWFFASRQKKLEYARAANKLHDLYDGEYGKQAGVYLQEYETLIHAPKEVLQKDYAENAASYYAVLERLSDTELTGRDIGENDLETDLVQEIREMPLNEDCLKVTLRNYQVFGAKYILHQKKVLLGDEMGLGKTIEALAVMADLYSRGRKYFLVACPTGIMVNWMREIRERTDIPAVMVHGQIVQKTREWLKSGGIAVTNYESLYRIILPEDIELDMITADEAHYAKNPAAIRTQALLRLTEKADYVLFMTGTPLENRVEEMSWLISCLRPDIGESIQGMTWFAEAPAFRREIAPVYLRRKRDEVLQELPELTEVIEWCRMNKSEYLAYFAAVEAGDLSDMRRVSWNARESTKAERLLEICLQARDEGRKVLVYSCFLDTIAIVRDLLYDYSPEPITGAMSSERRQAVIDEFSKNDDLSVLIAQIEAGGTGLNIQAASIVVLCEPQLKPSTEDQAIGRAYRMGQVNNVLVYRLMSEGSIDEYFLERSGRKREIFEDFADTSAMQEMAARSAGIQELIEAEKARLKQNMQGIQE